MGSLAGRVPAAGGSATELCKEPRIRRSPAVSLLRPALAAPLLTWTLQTQRRFRHLIAAPPTPARWRVGLLHAEFGDSAAALAHNNSFRFFRLRRRRSFRDLRICLTAARGDDATAVGDSKVREASLATRSSVLKWRLLSLITTVVLGGLNWLDGACARGQECMKPRYERLKMRSEPLRYWAYISCLLLCWLSIAFFLHWQVQRWELSTMVVADPQGVSDGAFDPGGSFCHSAWPNTGLGCQISFTAM